MTLSTSWRGEGLGRSREPGAGGGEPVPAGAEIPAGQAGDEQVSSGCQDPGAGGNPLLRQAGRDQVGRR